MESSSKGSAITAGAPVPDDKASSSGRKRTRKRTDTPPKQRKSPTPPKSEVTTQAIEDALAQILTLPAVPSAMLGDKWAEQHFTIQGRNFAGVLARQSERSPVLRSWCEKLTEGEALAVLVMAGVMYAMPPLMHWGIVPAPDSIKPVFGVPVTTPQPEAPPETSNESNTGNNGTNPHPDVVDAAGVAEGLGGLA